MCDEIKQTIYTYIHTQTIYKSTIYIYIYWYVYILYGAYIYNAPMSTSISANCHLCKRGVLDPCTIRQVRL